MLTFGSKNVKIIKRFENRYKKVSNIKKDVRIKIHSELYDVDASLFSDEEVDLNNVPISEETPEPDIFDMNSIGVYTDDGETMGYDMLARIGSGVSPAQFHAERINGFNPLAVIDAGFV